jgi:GntR family transcriptional regulator
LLDKSSKVPLYFQLKEIFLDRIRKGIYKTNEAIPSEVEIQKQFSVSRITVRRAIMELQRESYLDRKPGKGTFVNKYRIEKVVQKLSNISSWTETLEEIGLKPGTVKKEIIQIIPSKEVAIALNLESNEKLTKIKRWRTGNNKPFCIMTNYILSYFVPNIDKIDWGCESLYKVYEEKYNIKFGIARDTVEARVATKEESEFFNEELRLPVLLITRISYDSNNKPFEVVKQVTKAELYKYEVVVHGRPNKS